MSLLEQPTRPHAPTFVGMPATGQPARSVAAPTGLKRELDRSNPAKLRQCAVGALGKAYVVPVARACNATCVFCAMDVYKPRPAMAVMPVSGLTDALTRLSNAGVTRYEITGGGEPTLHPRLPEIVARIGAVPENYIKLNSNGYCLPDGGRVNELNLSRCAVDSAKNQKLMRLRNGSRELPELVGAARSRGYHRIRLAVPIIRGGVDGLAAACELVDAVAWLVDAVVFRPLYPATPNREFLDPGCEVDDWALALARLESVRASQCEVEVDTIGCMRPDRLILASDLRLYRDWPLLDPIDTGEPVARDA